MIIISEDNINMDLFFKNILNIDILINKNTKIPINIKSNNDNNIIYKNIEHDFHQLNNIYNNINNKINFDEIIININKKLSNNYIYLPSYNINNVDDDLLSLYEKYLNLNIDIICIVDTLNSNEYINLINSYENNIFMIYLNNNDNIYNYKHYYNINSIELKNMFNNNIKNEIINKLYLDLDNYDFLIKADYNTFYNHIFNSNNRHRHYYKSNLELLDEYKEYEEFINNAIKIFDETFEYYFKKLEPEILKYFVIMYYNSTSYDEHFENDKDYEFNLMLKGLRKMCITIVKRKVNN
jgi:hypothetical protein